MDLSIKASWTVKHVNEKIVDSDKGPKRVLEEVKATVNNTT